MRAQVEGHFLDAAGGPLALVAWSPPVGIPASFGVLFVPPFAEEMNKSRRMAAVQARAFAAAGGMVAAVDLRGTGDSGGDHADATWEGWREDVAQAFAWLSRRVCAPVFLWGLRLGALLAADAVDKAHIVPAGLVLWQPVASGRGFFNQFLRLANLRQRMQGDTDVDAGSAATPRGILASGTPVEIAGYGLHPRLVSGADAIELAQLGAPKCPVIVREVSPDSEPAVSMATQRFAERWRAGGSQVDVAAVTGPSFWATLEVEEAPDLVAATTGAVVPLLSELSGVLR